MAVAKLPAKVTLPEASLPYPTILEFLGARFPRVPREAWRDRIASGKVLDSRRHPISLDTPYEPLQRLYYFREVEGERAIPFEEEILYQDATLLVADKPHFLPTTEGGRFVEQCLLHRLRERTGCEAIAPLHRIDRETAGLVMFSLNPRTSAAYHQLFARGLVAKRYLAIARRASGTASREWQVENRLGRGEPHFLVRSLSGTVNARSRIELLETRRDRSLFRLYPYTGKKHQLRQHMASIGFPVENDKYYPNLQEESPDNYERPLQLLAKELEFADPLSGETRRFVSRRCLQWPERSVVVGVEPEFA